MNHIFTLFLLFAALTTHAQQATYQEFEVQKAAVPRGGLSVLNEFVTINIQKPFMAQVASVKGMVIVQGVVEPDGRMSEVKVLKSLRPDCDREAVRVFSLFNAWAPAQQDGRAVRQFVNYPVAFRVTEPVRYENGIAIRYYDKYLRALSVADTATFRSEVRTDTMGLPTGNLVFYKRNGTKWKKETELEYYSASISKAPMISNYMSKDSGLVVGHQDAQKRFFGHVFSVDQRGMVYNKALYDLELNPIWQIDRHKNGSVQRWETYNEQQSIVKYWYNNGQIQQVSTRPKFRLRLTSTQPQPDQLLAYWDSNGKQLINEGNGQLTTTERTCSYADTSRQTLFTEQGMYEQGLQQGRWTGQYADGSYSYVEDYDKGILMMGKAYVANQPDTVRYTVVEQQPEFEGGMQGLGQFLAKNLRYPIEAQRSRAQGRVFVSFVVCTDGSLCDYKVLKGFHPAADAEAIRVVKASSGQWKPGTQRGRPVRVKYNLPINFNLE